MGIKKCTKQEILFSNSMSSKRIPVVSLFLSYIKQTILKYHAAIQTQQSRNSDFKRDRAHTSREFLKDKTESVK